MTLTGGALLSERVARLLEEHDLATTPAVPWGAQLDLGLRLAAAAFVGKREPRFTGR